ncbi:MAG: hypothetical protein M0P49_00440 [Bacilli bacterium]|nr:hypothetical protein [Bacilli bacterium]
MKYMPTKVFFEHCRQTEKESALKDKLRENKLLEESAIVEDTRKAIFETVSEAKNKKTKFFDFSSSVKKSLLAESIYKLFDMGLGIHEQSVMSNAIKINLVNSFITENGADRLLSEFKYKSLLLSEISKTVTKYHKMIIESVDVSNEDSFKIDPLIKDDFFEELDMDNYKDVSIAIRTRVTDAVDEFIQSNIEDKQELKDAIQDAQNKILTAKTDEIKESFSQISKRKISKIRNGRKVNIFEAMVQALSKGVIQRDDLRESYTNNEKLDMDKIVESCKIMYTFLETVQTAKMVNIDEEYIENVLLDMSRD